GILLRCFSGAVFFRCGQTGHLYFTRQESYRTVLVDEPIFYEGWKYFKHHADKFYSLTDCISFIVMSKFGIWKALTFDKHFERAGFEKLPAIKEYL
ncbi:MAG: hypothetical protein B6245_18625, partial [Desulfobacteraceae bacterium 4572_88]